MALPTTVRMYQPQETRTGTHPICKTPGSYCWGTPNCQPEGTHAGVHHWCTRRSVLSSEDHRSSVFLVVCRWLPGGEREPPAEHPSLFQLTNPREHVHGLDLGDTSLTIHHFDNYCNNCQNIENNRFDCCLWKKHQKSFVSICTTFAHV